MNTIWTLAKKDLLLLLRDRLALFWMLLFPFVFAVFFGAIFGGQGSGGSNEIQVAVVDDGLDAGKEAFLARLGERPVELTRVPRAEASELVRRGKASAYLELVRVPGDAFALFRGEQAEIELGIDPSRMAERGMLEGFLAEASFGGLRDVFTDRQAGIDAARRARDAAQKDESIPLAQRLILTSFLGALETFFGGVEFGGRSADGSPAAHPMSGPSIRTVDVVRARNGPLNAYEISFPQAILWGLLGCAAGFAQTFVRERSSGTLVRLWTAPIGKATVLLGKLLACAIASAVVVAVLLAAGALIFRVGIGRPLTLVLAIGASAFCFGGLAVFLSTIGRTEQANAGIAWGLLCMLAMIGGGMVPQFVMPAWMKQLGSISPVRWTIEALEGGIWRDYSLADAALPLAASLGFGVLGLFAGLVRLRRI
ncbi:MAG: ABC transporter permease [Planctomycetes bacterium]|nr:ABC transporter permease [Planctomycetota bacterium]